MATSVSLELNCGYARCAIRELTTRNTDKIKRASEFQDLFKSCPNYGITESYFDTAGTNDSLFNRHCTKVIISWGKKWHPKESRVEYESNFAISKWKSLSTEDKQLHTISNCQQCQKVHLELQLKFPEKPHYLPDPLISLNQEELTRMGVKEGTRGVLKTLNESFKEVFEQPFTETAVKHGEARLQIKPTRSERNTCGRYIESAVTKRMRA